jgi:hypothetical protein
MIDTLYGADGPDSTPSKWKMWPFSTNWPASLFVSQDGVAIESVGFDFINREWGCAAYTDNLMHEAALANNPPSGKTYGPASLGVHEHWNNATDMQYCRNLGRSNGIELVRVVFPTPPIGLVASPSDKRIDLGWLSSLGASSYSVKRATNTGGPYAVLNGTSGTCYADTAVSNGVTYFYVVSMSNVLGESTNSAEVVARPGPVIRTVNCGGAAAGTFAADTNYVGGGTASNPSVIDTAGLSNPAPQGVYQTVRQGTFSYTFGGVVPGGPCKVRLHFAENYWTVAGKRIFNVSLNGTQVMTNFDIVAVTGGKSKAVIREFTVNASNTGQVGISFATLSDQAECSGIEVIPQMSFAVWQSLYFGTTNNPAAAAEADSSGTGQNNWFKYIAGLDPTNPASIFVVQLAKPASFPTVSFRPVASNRLYTVQVRPDLVDGLWTELAGYGGPVTNGNQVSLTDLAPPPSNAFYRVGITMP